jgi:hypothetical protein
VRKRVRFDGCARVFFEEGESLVLWSSLKAGEGSAYECSEDRAAGEGLSG